MGSCKPSSRPPTAPPLVLLSRWAAPGWAGGVGRASDAQLLRHLRRYVEQDGDWPQGAVGQAHALADRVVVRPLHETGQGREAAVEDQLEIAELARGEIP